MNAVDGSQHYERHSDEPPPALLTIILDTNPYGWSALAETLPLSKAIANILVFINAHLAFNYANKVAVIASHCQQARWLCPSHPGQRPKIPDDAVRNGAGTSDDTEMIDPDTYSSPSKRKSHLYTPSKPELNGDTDSPAPGGQPQSSIKANDANKYRPFRCIEDEVLSNLRQLISETDPSSLNAQDSTTMAGALSLALAYINKQTLAQADTSGTTITNPTTASGSSSRDAEFGPSGLQSRILIISVSGDQADQYIPIMNCIFAAQRKRIPIDVLKIASETAFLQQAADATRGIYMRLTAPQGLLQYLMMAFLSDQTARLHMVLPTQVDVDFRAACFCHKRVVDVGFVCSICLSIFCEPPPGAICLTCGTHLELGDYGSKPAVIPRKKKKRKKGGGGTGTPTAGGDTPAPE
ncbi:MAG: RNA polymerase II transcription factor B subunit 4 [Sclerophora amabilis]|nr:MAG: RNA polymerase II transcription factor B subunit 4 [Sclerophora amabilis]